MRGVEVGDGVGLVADEVVEAVGAVGVDEAVADPLARADAVHDGTKSANFRPLVLLLEECVYSRFINVANDLERILDAILLHRTRLQRSDILLPRVAQNIIRILASQTHQLPRLTPVNIPRLDLNPPDQLPALPVKEPDPTLALDAEENAPGEAVGRESDVDGSVARFGFEVAVHLHRVLRFADRVVLVVFFARPCEIHRGAEGLVAERESGVDDVLAVAADSHKPAIGRVQEGLRVDFRAAEILGGEGDGLAVFQRLVAAFEDGGQDFRVPGPDDLAAAVHGDGGFFSAHFDDYGSVVETHGDALAAALGGYTPGPFQAVGEGLLEPVGVGVPDFDRAVLGAGDDDRELGVVAGEGDIARVALERGDQRFGRVVPYLDRPVVRGGEQVRLVALRVVVDVIHTLRLMRLEREIRRPGPQVPYLNRPIQTRTRKSIRILRIDRQPHDIMTVSLKHLHALPLPFPIPQLDGHVIAGGQHERLGGVDGDGADVVRVGFEGGDFLGGVVVVDAQLEVVGAADDPVLAGDEAAGAHGHVGELEGLDDGLRLVGPDVDVARVEAGEDLQT